MASEGHHFTETTTTTTVTREYFDDELEPVPQKEVDESVADSESGAAEQDIPHVVETTTTTTVTREYHDDDDQPENVDDHEKVETTTTDVREVYETAQGEEPEHHYVETTTTTTVTEEVFQPDDVSPSDYEKPIIAESTTTVTCEPLEEQEGFRPPSGSEADDEGHAPRYLETTTTTTVTREYEVSEDDEERASPALSEEPVTRITERTTTTTVTQEHIEPEEHVVESQEYTTGSPVPSEEDVHNVVRTTTTTTVTREHFEPEDDGLFGDDERQASPTPSEDSVRQVVETTTTTTEELFEPEQDEEVRGFTQTTTTTTTTTTSYQPKDEVIESQEYATGSPTSPVKEEHVIDSEQYASGSPTFPQEHEYEPHHVTETTTTTTTREYFDDEPQHLEVSPAVAESEIHQELHQEQPASPSGSEVPSEHLISRVVETTITNVTREFHDELEQQAQFVSEKEQFHDDDYERPESPVAASPAPSSHVESERPVAESPAISENHDEPHYVTETTTTTTTTREYFEDEPEHHQDVHQERPESSSGSEVPLEHSISRVVETTTTTVTREFHDEPEYPAGQHQEHEQFVPTEQAPLLSQPQDSGDESDGEGFGSKVLGFAKKAGMVAGAVVAAPVALAAVGAKSAYDALKKSDDEDEPEEQEALLGESRERRSLYSPVASEKDVALFEQEPIHESPVTKIDDETQEPGATFYEPEEEDHVIESQEYSRSSSSKDEPKIISPSHSVDEGETEAAYIIESEQYEQAVHEEPRISSPVHSDHSGHSGHSDSGRVGLDEEELPRAEPAEKEDAPYVIDSEEYEFVGRDEPRIASPAHEDEDVIESEVYPRHQERHEDPAVIESEEYRRSPSASSETGSESRRPFEESTATTVISVHHEPAAIPEPEVDEEDAYQQEDKSIIDSEDYGHTTVTSVEAVEPSVVRSGSPTVVTTVSTEHLDQLEQQDPSVIESQEYTGSPTPSDDSVRRVVETTTITTVTSEHYEPEEPKEPVESAEHIIESREYSPTPSEKSERHVETTTTTSVTREHVEPEDLPASPAEEATHVIETTTTTTKTVEDDDESHVIETITTTTVTQERYDPEEEVSSRAALDEEAAHGFIKTTTTTTTTTSSFEPEDDIIESQEYKAGSPAPSDLSQHSAIKTATSAVTREEQHDDPEHFVPTEQAPLLSQPQDSGEESDGEGFGSKVLGFAKKAGMVAGAVVAAPVALAAVGAKSAYDALKKSDDEEEPEEQETLLGESRERRALDSPVASERDVASFEQESASESSIPVYEQERTAAELQGPSIHTESHQDSESEGSFVDHGEASEGLPIQSTEAAFKLSREDIAEQTAEKLVSEVFQPLDRTLIESEQYRASIESLNRPSPSPIEKKKSVDDLASEAFQNVTKISYGHADEGDDYKDQPEEEEEWKVYDRHGEVLEEFSTQLTDDVIHEAEGDATNQLLMRQEQQDSPSQVSPRRSTFLKQESCQEISNEPEVDYYSDLQEKLNILAGEKSSLGALVEEEPPSTASDQLDVIHESDHEHEEEHRDQKEYHHDEEHSELQYQEEEPTEEEVEHTALHLVDEVLEQVVHEVSDEEHDDQKTMTSDAYMTATSDGDAKDDQYDTCVTSQDDTYESAQGWTSQDSEYTTATSQAPSRLSDSEGEHTARDQERQETSTPQAMLSPVDSDRQFTVQQDYELPVLPAIRAFDVDDFQSTARSTPDVALQVTIEEEDESDDKLPISPSGVLLPPAADPGRPVSPVPPRREGAAFEFPADEIVEPTPPPVPAHEQETDRIHGVAMEASSDPANSESSRYSRQLSDLSSSAETESHAETVIRVEGERSGSSDSLEVISVISGGKSSTPEKEVVVEEPVEGGAAQMTTRQEEEHPEDPKEAEELGFEVYDADTEEGPQIPIEELETVEEEPEDSDSLNEGNGSGHSSVGVPADTLAMIGKYRHQSSDNLSLTSLQEFERLEKEVGARGDGSLTRSEIELLVAGRLNKSGEGSVSSLAEFERLEKEMTENQSPPEDVMMLSDIREESEAEDMSIRDDDEDEALGSDTELKSRPVQEEDLRGVTPVAPSPTDSLEHQVDPVQLQYLETSTDSLEPTFQEIEVEQRADSAEDTSLAEYEMVPRVMEASTTDSLDGGIAGTEKDSLLEGASQGIESTQSTHGLLSGDTMGTVVTDDDDKDSLDGEVSSMLQSYPTTLTTFQTTVVAPDGSVQTISRRVETRVTDPLVSHVTFTGTESQERLDQLPDDEQFETVDTEGNVTRTTFRRDHEQHPHY